MLARKRTSDMHLYNVWGNFYRKSEHILTLRLNFLAAKNK